MTCTNFPSAGLVIGVTTHQVGEIIYLWSGVVWEAIINSSGSGGELSQAYTFPTVAAYKASTIVFPIGKIINLLDRGASFTIITGTGAADNYGIVASDNVSQSISINVGYSVYAEQFGASTSIEDNSGAINAALESAATTVGSKDELRIQASVVIPTYKQCDGLKVYADGNTFTSHVMPVCLVVNKTFGTLATADKDIHFRNGSVRVSNNPLVTGVLNPKLIMFGGVKNGWIQNNTFIANGGKHSAAIECYKSTENIWIENNTIEITTGDTTGGGIWLANRTTGEVSNNIHVNNNTIKQDSVDEVIAIFPVAGPMQKLRLNNNLMTRLNSGASDGPVLRVFCGDGLVGGEPTATIKDVKGFGNSINQLKTDNIVSGVMQIGNASLDANDPEDVVFTETTITGYFAATTIGLRFDFNQKAKGVSVHNTYVINEGAFSASNQGIVDTTGEIVMSGGEVENFGTNIAGWEVNDFNVNLGSIGIKVTNSARGNTCTGMGAPMRVSARGANVSQVIEGNTLVPVSTGRCLQLDATNSTMSNLRILNNNFVGTVGSVTAIEKVGSNTISTTQTQGNDFSTCSTLWSNTLGMLLGRNTYDAAITNPVGAINADPGSEFLNTSGVGGTLYIKETTTGNTGWVGK